MLAFSDRVEVLPTRARVLDPVAPEQAFPHVAPTETPRSRIALHPWRRRGSRSALRDASVVARRVAPRSVRAVQLTRLAVLIARTAGRRARARQRTPANPATPESPSRARLGGRRARRITFLIPGAASTSAASHDSSQARRTRSQPPRAQQWPASTRRLPPPRGFRTSIGRAVPGRPTLALGAAAPRATSTRTPAGCPQLARTRRQRRHLNHGRSSRPPLSVTALVGSAVHSTSCGLATYSVP